MKSIMLLLFVSLITLVIYMTVTLGVFKQVTVTEGPYQELHLLYKDHLGPYHTIAEVIKDVETWAQAQGIDCKITFGQFIDDPSVVEHERLKSRGGCVVATFPKKFPIEMKTLLIPARNYILAHFHGSPWLGPYKVYAKVAEFANERKVRINEPVIELYKLIDDHHLETTYLFPWPLAEPIK